ncbi:hypothetical protein [Flavobacterium sp. ABG]|uniref:hypothetical protein n=1 Tax=Flavobacterium sp. ABG TaxID=1423322 RepID=UPI00064A69BF|nr:hypothetical protein [Flavobacterium sp. ABG]KLT70347.1 hypothetical protein AB674_06635 [Flavobacterium sp. ABG]
MKIIEFDLITHGKPQKHLINIEHIMYVEENLSSTKIMLSNGEKKDIKLDYITVVEKIKEANSKQ